MNRTVVAVRHVVFEDLGVLAPLLTGRGYRVRYFDAGIELFDTATLVRSCIGEQASSCSTVVPTRNKRQVTMQVIQTSPKAHVKQ
jgi:hypothetical protein